MKRDELEAMIRNAPREEIDAYFDAAIERKQELYPDWGILYMAIPKNDPVERKKTIQGIIRMLENEKQWFYVPERELP